MKRFVHLSELQFFAKRPTSLLLKDGSIKAGFTSQNEAREYAIKNKIVYKSIINECLIEKY